MAGIEEYLDKIKNAVYGRDVRQAIHDGIEACYEDGKVGAVDLVARQRIAQAISPSGEAPSAAEVTDGRVVDEITYSLIGDAIRAVNSNLRSDIKTISSDYIAYNILHDVKFKDYTTSGVAVSGNVYNGVSVVGTNSSSGASAIILSEPFPLKKNTRYKLYEESPAVVSEETYRLDIRNNDDWSEIITYESSELGAVFFTGDEDVEAALAIRLAGNFSIDMQIKPHLVEYSEKTSVEIYNNKGNNLIASASYSNATVTQNGVTAIDNHDGSVTLSGTATNTTALALINRYHKIVLEGGHSYVFGSNSDSNDRPSGATYRLDLRKVSDASTVVTFEQSFGGVIHVPETDTYTVYLRVNNGYALNGMVIKPYICDVEDMDNKLSSFRICEYNVGNFSHGASATSSGDDEMFAEFLEAFKKADANVYSFSEWDEYWNTEGEILSEEKFEGLKPYHTVSYDKTAGRYTASMNYSEYPFCTERFEYFGDGESRSYTDNTIIIGNKLVHLIATHLPFSSQSLRQTDLNKIFTYIQNNNIEYFVVVGDFNLGLGGSASVRETAISDIDFLKGKNVYSVQGGFWGGTDEDNLINTFDDGDNIAPYDNIITSKNIFIKNAFVIDSQASDHYPLCADLMVVG